MDPGLSVVVSLLAGGAISAAVHVTRATVRPVVNLAFLGPPMSFVEDAGSAVLTLAAALVPILVPFLLALFVLAAVMLWARRRTNRPPALSRR
jgi:hypothetical protein